MSKPTGTHQDSPSIFDGLWQTLCRIGAIKFLILVSIAVNCFAIFPFLLHRNEQQDFAHYYVSSNLWLEGSDIYQVDLVPEYEKLGWEEFDESVVRATNPPALIAFFSPFARLKPSSAHVAWAILQLICFVVAVLLTWQLVKDQLSIDGFGFILVVFLLLPMLKYHFYFSQTQLLLLAMVLSAYSLLPKTNAKLKTIRFHGPAACAIIAIAALLKVFPLVLLPWFVWRSGNSVTQRVAAGTAAVATLVAGVWFSGVQYWCDFIEFGLVTISLWVKEITECFTLGNAFHQIGSLITGNPESDFFLRVGTVTGLLLIAAFYGRLLFQRTVPQRQALNVELSLLIVLMLFCGGICWWHYLVFLFFPMQVIATKLKPRRSLPIVVAATFTLLLLANITLPSTKSELVTLLGNQRPLIAMIVMAAFLAASLTFQDSEPPAKE